MDLQTDSQAVLLKVKVVPGASRTRYMGEWDGRARIAVAAAPQKGRANAEVISWLTRLLGVHKKDVTVVRGAISPLKTIRIERVAIDAVRAALQPGQS